MEKLLERGSGRCPSGRQRGDFVALEGEGEQIIRFVLSVSLLALGILAGVPGFSQDYPRYRPVGSTFVPLDSWVYPALERLAASGYVKTMIVGIKPWARSECARLTEEAGETIREALLEDRGPEEEVAEIYSALQQEFRFEIGSLAGGSTRSLRVESAYARVTSISGPVLTDGFHFGQTISYDFGRPFRRGTNAIAGVSGSGTWGPLAFYIQGEYQHAPSAPALSDLTLDIIAERDGQPRLPAEPFEPINRGRLLDAYASFNLKNWQISFGKQSLNWGPGFGGSLIVSRNAEPITMLRFTRMVPFALPGWLRVLGAIRSEFFVGRLGGHVTFPSPIIHGQKLSFKLSPNMEFGMGRTTLLGGGGRPITPRLVVRSFLGLEEVESVYGDTRVTWDWNYRIPGLRNHVTFYGELYGDDHEIPLRSISKIFYRPGIRVSNLPGLPKMQFSIEVANSESPGRIPNAGRFNYFNPEFPDGYTNNGTLLGNTTGREGRTVQFWADYRVSPRQLIQVSFKDSRVYEDFIPEGGRWQDFSIRHEIYRSSGWYARSQVQFEHILRYPVLFSGSQHNVVAAIEIGFMPEDSIL